MNENTLKILQELAAKLGTTVDYLWIVLLKQAQIAGFMNLFFIVAFYSFGIILYRLHIKLSKELEEDTSYYRNLYAKSDSYGIAMTIGTVFFGVMSIIHFYAIQEMFTAFYNPEYWALKQILNKI